MSRDPKLFVNDLGEPLTFCITGCVMPGKLSSIIEEGGGRVVKKEGPHTVTLVQRTSSNPRKSLQGTNSFFCTYIQDCVRLRRLLLLRNYWAIKASNFNDTCDPQDVMMGMFSWESCHRQPHKCLEEDKSQESAAPGTLRDPRSLPLKACHVRLEKMDARAIRHAAQTGKPCQSNQEETRQTSAFPCDVLEPSSDSAPHSPVHDHHASPEPASKVKRLAPKRKRMQQARWHQENNALDTSVESVSTSRQQARERRRNGRVVKRRRAMHLGMAEEEEEEEEDEPIQRRVIRSRPVLPHPISKELRHRITNTYWGIEHGTFRLPVRSATRYATCVCVQPKKTGQLRRSRTGEVQQEPVTVDKKIGGGMWRGIMSSDNEDPECEAVITMHSSDEESLFSEEKCLFSLSENSQGREADGNSLSFMSKRQEATHSCLPDRDTPAGKPDKATPPEQADQDTPRRQPQVNRHTPSRGQADADCEAVIMYSSDEESLFSEEKCLFSLSENSQDKEGNGNNPSFMKEGQEATHSRLPGGPTPAGKPDKATPPPEQANQDTSGRWPQSHTPRTQADQDTPGRVKINRRTPPRRQAGKDNTSPEHSEEDTTSRGQAGKSTTRRRQEERDTSPEYSEDTTSRGQAGKSTTRRQAERDMSPEHSEEDITSRRQAGKSTTRRQAERDTSPEHSEEDITSRRQAGKSTTRRQAERDTSPEYSEEDTTTRGQAGKSTTRRRQEERDTTSPEYSEDTTTRGQAGKSTKRRQQAKKSTSSREPQQAITSRGKPDGATSPKTSSSRQDTSSPGRSEKCPLFLSPPNRGHHSRSKKNESYSVQEDLDIVKYIDAFQEYQRLGGREVWKEMEHYFKYRRTWQSLKERFRKRIAPNLCTYIHFGLKSQVVERMKHNIVIDVEPGRRQRKRRKEFIKDEDLCILHFISVNHRYQEVGGVMMWKEMASCCDELANHTWHSLKTRFHKRILPNLSDYNLPNTVVLQLQNRKRITKLDRPRSSESDSSLRYPRKRRDMATPRRQNAFTKRRAHHRDRNTDSDTDSDNEEMFDHRRTHKSKKRKLERAWDGKEGSVCFVTRTYESRNKKSGRARDEVESDADGFIPHTHKPKKRGRERDDVESDADDPASHTHNSRKPGRARARDECEESNEDDWEPPRPLPLHPDPRKTPQHKGKKQLVEEDGDDNEEGPQHTSKQRTQRGAPFASPSRQLTIKRFLKVGRKGPSSLHSNNPTSRRRDRGREEEVLIEDEGELVEEVGLLEDEDEEEEEVVEDEDKEVEDEEEEKGVEEVEVEVEVHAEASPRPLPSKAQQKGNRRQEEDNSTTTKHHRTQPVKMYSRSGASHSSPTIRSFLKSGRRALLMPDFCDNLSPKTPFRNGPLDSRRLLGRKEAKEGPAVNTETERDEVKVVAEEEEEEEEEEDEDSLPSLIIDITPDVRKRLENGAEKVQVQEEREEREEENVRKLVDQWEEEEEQEEENVRKLGDWQEEEQEEEITRKPIDQQEEEEEQEEENMRKLVDQQEEEEEQEEENMRKLGDQQEEDKEQEEDMRKLGDQQEEEEEEEEQEENARKPVDQQEEEEEQEENAKKPVDQQEEEEEQEENSRKPVDQQEEEEEQEENARKLVDQEGEEEQEENVRKPVDQQEEEEQEENMRKLGDQQEEEEEQEENARKPVDQQEEEEEQEENVRKLGDQQEEEEENARKLVDQQEEEEEQEENARKPVDQQEEEEEQEENARKLVDQQKEEEQEPVEDVLEEDEEGDVDVENDNGNSPALSRNLTVEGREMCSQGEVTEEQMMEEDYLPSLSLEVAESGKEGEALKEDAREVVMEEEEEGESQDEDCSQFLSSYFIPESEFFKMIIAVPSDNATHSSPPPHQTTPVHLDSPHTTPVHLDSPHTTPVHLDSPHTTPVHDSPHTTPVHHDSPHTTPVHHDSPHTTPVHLDSPHTTPVHHDSPHTTPVHLDSPHTTPVHHDSSHTTPVHHDSPHTTPVHHDSPHTTPVHLDSPHTTPVHHDSSHTTPVHHDSPHTTPVPS
ncbi:hypothetical protein O3P69_012942 [Scylla paramamosain]|uniref:TERF2-interacting telomeric protein 1 Myb domain-containing protein n=1 Tax=Scylla paramamosain TaxID=85552 RepID=A0AAW0TSC2_SCYPA